MRWILLFLAIFIAITIMRSCANTDTYMQAIHYGSIGRFDKAKKMIERCEGIDYPPFQTPNFTVRQLKELIGDVQDGKITKETGMHVFKGIYYIRVEQTLKMSMSELSQLVFDAKENPKRTTTKNMAKEEFEIALAINPNTAMAHFGMGVFYASNVMDDKAIVEFKKVVTLKPDDNLVHLELGKIYYNKGLLEESIEEHRKALAIGVDSKHLIFLHRSLGLAYYRTKKYDSAVEYLKKAIEIGDKSDVTVRFLKDAEAAKK